MIGMAAFAVIMTIITKAYRSITWYEMQQLCDP